jgi:SAM-dependent methyltransferase
MALEWVHLADEAGTVEEFQARALELLQARNGFDVAFLAVAGDERRAVGRGLDPTEVLRRFSPASVYARELLPVKTAALKGRGVALDVEVLGQRGVENSAYFRDFVRPRGGRHSLMAYLRLRGIPFGTLVLGRATAFSAREVRDLEGTLPALSVARASYGLPITGLEPPPPALSGASLARLGRLWSGGVLERARLRDGGEVVVRDRDGLREMVAVDQDRELVWSRAHLSEPARSGWPYIELLHVAATVASRRSRALFIGCGGGVVIRQFARSYPGIVIDVVDREPAVIDLAETWFGLDALPGVTTHVADGAAFVAAAPPASWDVVVIDAYGASLIEERFAAAGFFAELRRALSPGGAVSCNVIGSLEGDGPVRATVKAARAVFSDVRMVPVVETDETFRADTLRNVVVIAR